MITKTIPAIGTFFAFALGLSFVASLLPPFVIGNFDVRLVLCGFGPMAAGMLCYRLYRRKNALGITPLGTRPIVSLLVVAVALTVFSVTQSKHALGSVLTFPLPKANTKWSPRNQAASTLTAEPAIA